MSDTSLPHYSAIELRRMIGARQISPVELMDACIANGWTHFEPGAGGGHKINRGMLPVLVDSAHWLAHPAFRQVIADHVAGERTAMAEHLDDMAMRATTKRDGLIS